MLIIRESDNMLIRKALKGTGVLKNVVVRDINKRFAV